MAKTTCSWSLFSSCWMRSCILAFRVSSICRSSSSSIFWCSSNFSWLILSSSTFLSLSISSCSLLAFSSWSRLTFSLSAFSASCLILSASSYKRFISVLSYLNTWLFDNTTPKVNKYFPKVPTHVSQDMSSLTFSRIFWSSASNWASIRILTCSLIWNSLSSSGDLSIPMPLATVWSAMFKDCFFYFHFQLTAAVDVLFAWLSRQNTLGQNGLYKTTCQT